MQNVNNEIQNLQEPPEPLAESPAAAEVASTQPILKRIRDSKRLSVGDVAYALKVSPRVIDALEAGEWDKLPGRTFVIGTLRAYGRLLDVSVDDLVASIPGSVPAMVKKAAAPSSTNPAKPMVPKPRRDGETKRQTNRMLKSGLALILIALLLTYAVPRDAMQNALLDAQSFIQGVTGSKTQGTPTEGDAQEPAQPVSSAEQAGAAPAAAAEQQAQTGAGTLELRFSAPAWVEVRDHTGRIIYSQLNAAGTTQFITGAAPLDVMIGNAKQVQARWRDEPLKLDKLSGDDVARQILR